MTNDDAERAALAKTLSQLCDGDGLRQPNLATALGERLRRLVGVRSEYEPDAKVFEQVSRRLLQTISRIPNAKHRSTALVRFNIGGAEYAEIHGSILTERVKWLARGRGQRVWYGDPKEEPGHVGKSTGRTYMRADIIPAIITDLLASQSDAQLSIACEDTRPGGAKNQRRNGVLAIKPAYVRREALHCQFDELLSGEVRLVALVGQAGMGKTWLARELTKSADGTEAPLIRIIDGEPDTRDLLSAMTGQSSEERFRVANGPKDLLAILVSGQHAPKFVVLDGLDDSDELSRLLPPITSINSTVIATCRRKGVLQSEPCHLMRINALENHEAIELIRRRLPAVSLEDAEYLASYLHGYPLVIGSACALIENQSLPVRQFCIDLASSHSDVADHVYAADRNTLLAIIRKMILCVEEQDALALELLTFISFLYIKPPIRQDGFLLRYLSVGKEAAVTKVRYAQALELLRRFQIVDLQIDGHSALSGFANRYFYGREPQIALHQLTHKLLFEHFKSNASSVLWRYHLTFEALLREMGQDQVYDDSDNPLWDEYRAAEACDKSLEIAAYCNDELARARRRGFTNPIYIFLRDINLRRWGGEVDDELFGPEFAAERKRIEEETRRTTAPSIPHVPAAAAQDQPHTSPAE